MNRKFTKYTNLVANHNLLTETNRRTVRQFHTASLKLNGSYRTLRIFYAYHTILACICVAICIRNALQISSNLTRYLSFLVI